MIIGVTGISGAGKSTVSKLICKEKQAKYVNADKIAKELSGKRRKILQRNSKIIWKRDFKERLRNRQTKTCKNNIF